MAQQTEQSAHKHGSMDIKAQQQTFEGFVKWLMRVAGLSLAVLIFLALFNS
ncbi:MAG: aa3-type cytochrome c oxidase subunit IV [Rhodobacteraceae bacterium]|nr:aa3-type cytochrome c oxidase subunit IV [Paracoccaceae bacterium]